MLGTAVAAHLFQLSLLLADIRSDSLASLRDSNPWESDYQ